MSYAIYLRKSRADTEAEQRGEGETLTRHKNILLEIAKKHNLTITQIYHEIVSGDSISSRPQMQKLLQDITDNKYIGVLVMEIERLARGDTIDQGIVAQAFKSSNTKIITPTKTYDPNNEFDEEYFEFSLFMSRREYKTIKRRMQSGRIASVKEGNYIYTNAPYGYRKIHPEPKIHTLEIIPNEAETVQKIYNLYLSGKGAGTIATELNSLQISPQKSALWEKASIRKILTNPIYAGKIRWKDKNGIIICDGLHKAIISPEQWELAQNNMKSRPLANLTPKIEMTNYYHNILFCGNCGHQMKRRPTNNGYMLCRYNQCKGKTVASPINCIDDILLSSISFRLLELNKYLYSDSKNNKIEAYNNQINKKIETINSALNKLKKQQNKLHTLLETDVYTIETYLERHKILSQQKENLEKELKELELKKESHNILPNEAVLWFEYIIASFNNAIPKDKNYMLMSVIKRVDYYKNIRMCKNKYKNDLHLDIYFL